LRQKVEDHKPDLICADALYLMRNDRSGGKRSIKWDDQAAITQDLKDLALDVNKPLVGTTQAKRESEEKKGQSVSNISFSDSYGMDCDLAIEIIKKKITDETNELALAITGAREINISGFAVNGNAATDFGPLYVKYRDEAGIIQADEGGNPLVVPVIFSDYKDIKDFLKLGEDDDKKQQPKSKAQMSALAKSAFRVARKSI
jgi:DnaB-like helicase C terminal domain.